MAVVSVPSLGGFDGCPDRRLVECAAEARSLNKVLDERGRDVVALGLVFGQLPAQERKDVRAQVRNGGPRHNELDRNLLTDSI